MTRAVTRTACAKVILCGEHAVVYGRPAIALPLSRLRTTATVAPAVGDRPFHICAPDIRADFDIVSDPTRPLSVLSRVVVEALGLPFPAATLTVTSDIPPASHLGSSASVAVACVRAIAAYCGRELSVAEISRLAFEVEKIYHGSPSGIDNTVVVYEQPVWFARGRSNAGATVMVIPQAPHLVIADTGVAVPTRIPVGDVRKGWETDPARYESLFDQIAGAVTAARAALLASDWPALGARMDANHALLQQLGVSSSELDALCDTARKAGALGAKPSGGGRGGNMIALAPDSQTADELRLVLREAGASRVI